MGKERVGEREKRYRGRRKLGRWVRCFKKAGGLDEGKKVILVREKKEILGESWLERLHQGMPTHFFREKYTNGFSREGHLRF